MSVDYSISLSKWVAQFTLTRETGWVTRVRVPFEFTIIYVAIAIGIDHAVCWVIRIKLEVEFPTCCHAIIIVVLIVNLRAIVPLITVRII
jgi:hypothetical protein